MGADAGDQRVTPLLGQRRNARDIDRQTLGHLAPQRRRQRRGDLLAQFFRALCGALLFDVGRQLLCTHGTGLGLGHRRGQPVALLGYGPSLRCQLRRLRGALGRRSQLRQLLVDAIQLGLQCLSSASASRRACEAFSDSIASVSVASASPRLRSTSFNRESMSASCCLGVGSSSCASTGADSRKAVHSSRTHEGPVHGSIAGKKTRSHTGSRGPPRLRATIRHRR